MMHRPLYQQGLSLIEMLVTALVGVLVLISVGTSISAMTQTQSRVDRYEQAQETLRFTTALLDISLRTAESLDDAQSNEFTLTRVAFGRTDPDTGEEIPVRSCIGSLHTEADGSWQERFFYDETKGHLYCELLGTDKMEVIAYGLKELEWEFAEYSSEQEIIWQKVNNQENIIAVKAELKLEELNKQYVHTWVLRKAFLAKING